MQLHDLRFATLSLLVSTPSVWAVPPAAFNVSNDLQQPNSGDANLTSPLTIALPHNLTTSPPPLSWSNLPSDPFVYPVPHSSGVTLKFYDYGRPIDDEDTSRVLGLTAEQALYHRPATRMGTQPIAIVARDVLYTFSPSLLMTWGVYASAIRGVEHFVSTYQYVELQFEVQFNGVSVMMGVGRLSAWDL